MSNCLFKYLEFFECRRIAMQSMQQSIRSGKNNKVRKNLCSCFDNIQFYRKSNYIYMNFQSKMGSSIHNSTMAIHVRFGYLHDCGGRRCLGRNTNIRKPDRSRIDCWRVFAHRLRMR